MTARGPAAGPAPEVTVGIDLGGTGTRLVALGNGGEVQGRLSRATLRGVGAGPLIASLTSQIRSVAGGGVLTAVGIGASGPVDGAGVIRNDATLPAYSHLPLTALLTAELGVPCAIANDAVTAAIGENSYGAGQQSPALLAVTLGTGIGVALLTRGSAYAGSDGLHPEAGHIPVPGPPAPCYCGLPTCWEQLASRTALDAAAGHATARIASLAAAGDERSRDIFAQYGEYVGAGLAILTTVLRPARVVIGGSAAQYLPLLRPGLDRASAQLAPFACNPPAAGAALGEYSGAIGAAVLARSAS